MQARQSKVLNSTQASLDQMIGTFLDSYPDAMLFFDAEGQLTHFNKKFQETLFPSNQPKVIHSRYYVLEQLEKKVRSPNVLKHRIETLGAGNRASTLDYLTLTDERIFECSSWVQILDDQYLGRYFVFHEVTQRIMFENVREQSQEALRCLVAAAFEGIAIHDQGVILFANESFTQMFGYSPEELVGRNVLDLAVPEYKETVAAHVRSGDEHPYESRAVRKDGCEFWALVQGKSMTFMGKHVRVTVVQDITQRKNFEIALKNSEERLRSILQNAPDVAIQTFDIDGRVHSWNPAAERMYGFTEREALGKTLDQLILSKDENQQFLAQFKHLVQTNEPPLPYIYETFSKNGEKRIVRSTLFAVHHTTGNLYVCMDVDISEAVIAQEKLKAALEREKSLHAVVNAQKEVAIFLNQMSKKLSTSLDLDQVCQILTEMSVPYLADWSLIATLDEDNALRLRSFSPKSFNSKQDLPKDLDNCIKQLNVIAPQLFNRSSKSEIKKMDGKYVFRCETALPSEAVIDNDRCIQVFQELRAERCLTFPLIAREKFMGSIVFMMNPGREHSNEKDKAAAEVASLASLALENIFLYAESQERVKEREAFISIASHELKTPLTSLKMHLELIDHYLSRGQIQGNLSNTLGKVLSTANGEIERFSKLIQVLLDASRAGAGKLVLFREPTNISNLVENTLSRFQKELEAVGCSLVKIIHHGIEGFWDKIRIEQIVANLISNAMKFGAGKPIEVKLWKDQSGQVLLSVKDHGIGISKENQNKIFQRFERAVSDRSYSGLGLGLYITYELVRAHQGTITVESTLGKGATFTVRLPA
jgi:PAS domain S-box-containing protein